jgi:hypothetical protein
LAKRQSALDESARCRAVGIAGSREPIASLRSADLRLPIFDDAGESVTIFGFDAQPSACLISFHEEDRLEATIPVGEREAFLVDESSHQPLLIVRELVKFCSCITNLVGMTIARSLELSLVESPADCESAEQGNSSQEKSESHDSAQVKGSGQSQAAH